MPLLTAVAIVSEPNEPLTGSVAPNPTGIFLSHVLLSCNSHTANQIMTKANEQEENLTHGRMDDYFNSQDKDQPSWTSGSLPITGGQ
ncbi:hypothetical protein JTE90_013335 [Oedothorax gibbosus]|uniref:Uncharacterized protein n=1 Tax=Oedothorax gibbosus TaxID=931172 RepID=A0AAV6VF77_9ARAC|nr:hypothetical protein JTE90_013335 [Oedothorax gibbosus]